MSLAVEIYLIANRNNIQIFNYKYYFIQIWQVMN